MLVSKEMPSLELFERHVGTFKTMNDQYIKINHKGMADAYGLITVKNILVHIEIEFKTGKAKQTKEQKAWQRYIELKKGVYIVVRDVDTGMLELKKKIGSLY